MRHFKFVLALTTSLFLALTVAKAQSTAVSDCKIDYKINLNDPNMDPMAKLMMSGAKMSISFLGAKSRVDMNMNAMMRTVAISDETTDESIVLMDMLGKKMAMVPEEDAASIKKDYEGKATKTSKTKDIAGYKCEEYVVKTKEGDELHMWCTSKIQPKSKTTDFSVEGVAGFPLEMDMSQDGMKFKMVATKVYLEKPDSKLFSTKVPPGYELKTQKEMEEEFGGGK